MANTARESGVLASLADRKARAAMSRGGASVHRWMQMALESDQQRSVTLDRYVDSGVWKRSLNARSKVLWPVFPEVTTLLGVETALNDHPLNLRFRRVTQPAPRTMRLFSMKSQLETRGLESSTADETAVSSVKRARKVLNLNDPETYARLQRMVRKVCPAWLERERDDFAQKAMIRLLERAKKLGANDEQGLCASYLYRTAHSTVIDEIRKRKREVLAEDIEDYRCDAGHAKHEELRSSESPLGNASSKALRVAIQDCLTKLAPERSRAVSLRLEGFKISEIAEMLDWNKKRAENLERRGRENLRDCLKGKGYEVQC